ncbi:hypothetical protein [Acinetobacter sp. ANC 3832]|uniref:hypothetical protein n=1 Tax=Acinetobacter sp. ANC 3832 TaxID=1977874 RepID=UPI000A357C49|nr:hypothetical protein [Acinetobacter sp. ANC 3832]OTG96373.1 peptide signal protein [Acinetobacter sp. ANC 3832]
MNFIKFPMFIAVIAYLGMPIAQAEDAVKLPTLTVLAESELRDEVGFVPYQEDKPVRQALQRFMLKNERDIQNFVVDDSFTEINLQPKLTEPDMSQLSPALQQYVLAVASGLQSSDPTTGLFTLLKQFGIDRSNVDGIRGGTVKLNIDPNLLQQLKDNKWQMR